MRILICALALALGALSGAAHARSELTPLPGTHNGLAQTPPMGWNSWNKYGCEINETIIRAQADAMVASGMRDAGYEYIVIDDCWQGARDERGDIQPDATRFPSGMRALSDYIHARGLKFGIYSDAGEKTCGGRPGSWGHEYQDARQYARWGVDYLKYDWCNTGDHGGLEGPAYRHNQNAVSAYLLMSQALQATGRPIVFSICEWGNNEPWLWAQNIGNLWRTTGDIYDAWEGRDGWSIGVMNIVDIQANLWAYSRPGNWNDPDMLEVGNGAMSDTEYRAHFSLWAMFAAPLIAGNDLSTMNDATRTILTNREVIAVDQDPLGRAARKVADEGDYEVWVRPLAGGGRAVVLLNRSAEAHPITVTWDHLDYPAHLSARVRDLWRHANLRNARGQFTATVEGHGVVMVTITP
jgi:alpha-galactosidase